jgi:hypothetical protein
MDTNFKNYRKTTLKFSHLCIDTLTLNFKMKKEFEKILLGSKGSFINGVTISEWE